MKAKLVLEMAKQLGKFEEISKNYQAATKDVMQDWSKANLEGADKAAFDHMLNLCIRTAEAAGIFEDYLDREIDAV